MQTTAASPSTPPPPVPPAALSPLTVLAPSPSLLVSLSLLLLIIQFQSPLATSISPVLLTPALALSLFCPTLIKPLPLALPHPLLATLMSLLHPWATSPPALSPSVNYPTPGTS